MNKVRIPVYLINTAEKYTMTNYKDYLDEDYLMKEEDVVFLIEDLICEILHLNDKIEEIENEEF